MGERGRQAVSRVELLHGGAHRVITCALAARQRGARLVDERRQRAGLVAGAPVSEVMPRTTRPDHRPRRRVGPERVERPQPPAERAQPAGGGDRLTATLAPYGRHVLRHQHRLSLVNRDRVGGGNALGRILELREAAQDLGVAVNLLARAHRREQADDPARAVGATDPVDAEVELIEAGDLDLIGRVQVRRQRRHPTASGSPPRRAVGPRAPTRGGHGAAVRPPVKPKSRLAIRRSWSSSEPSVMR